MAGGVANDIGHGLAGLWGSPVRTLTVGGGAKPSVGLGLDEGVSRFVHGTLLVQDVAAQGDEGRKP